MKPAPRLTLQRDRRWTLFSAKNVETLLGDSTHWAPDRPSESVHKQGVKEADQSEAEQTQRPKRSVLRPLLDRDGLLKRGSLTLSHLAPRCNPFDHFVKQLCTNAGSAFATTIVLLLRLLMIPWYTPVVFVCCGVPTRRGGSPRTPAICSTPPQTFLPEAPDSAAGSCCCG